MIFFLVGSYLLGIAWIAIFWLASFMAYLIAWLCSLFGAYVNISDDNNVWFLFMVVIGISAWAGNIPEDAATGWCVFVFLFLTGSFSLFRSAENWRIASA